MHTVIVDFETRSRADLRKCGAYIYARHASTAMLCISFAVDDGAVKLWWPTDPPRPEIVEAAGDPDAIFVAFNAPFEIQIWQHVLSRLGWPDVPPVERWRCLQARALVHALPAALEDVGEVLQLTHRKGNDTAMRKLSKPRKDGTWETDPKLFAELGRYCTDDVASERELAGRLQPLLDAEQTLWELDQKINSTGFPVDRALLAGALKIAAAAEENLERVVRELTDGVVETVHQTARIKSWLAAHGCPITDVKKATISAALRRTKLQPGARRLLELRRNGAHTGGPKLATLQAYCAADNRVRGCLRFHGAAPGRWVGQGPQPQNFRKATLEPAAIDLVAAGDLEQLQARYEQPLAIISDIGRALILAPEGKRLIVGDYTGVESIVTAALSSQQDKVEQWRRFIATGDPGDDPYLTLGRRLGVPEAQARDIGKRADLAFGYGGGLGAWRNMAPEGDTTTDGEVEHWKQAWRGAHPETARYWKWLERAAIAAVQNPGAAQRANRIACIYEPPFLFAELPSKRRISYPYPKLIMNRFGNVALSFSDNAGGRWVDCNFGHGTYGGALMENVVQGVARDLLAQAMVRLSNRGYEICLHIHDEIVAEVAEDFGSAEEFARLMTTPPAWAEGWPLAVKTRNGPRSFAKFEAPKNAAPQRPKRIRLRKRIRLHEPDPDDDTPSAVDPPPAADPSQADTSEPSNDPRPFDSEPGVNPTAARFTGSTEEPPEEEAPPEDGKGNGRDDDDVFHAYTAANRQKHGGGSHKVGQWIYQWLDGSPYLRVDRMQSAAGAKWYPQFHFAHGAWQSGEPAGPHIPYRLPELVAAARRGGDIHVGEGEAVSDAITGLGLVATTNSGGAGKWWSELARWFTGFKRAFIHEDNDKPGRKHAARVAAAMAGTIPEIRIVSYPDLPEKGDAKDWLAAGHTREEFAARCEAAPPLSKLGCSPLEVTPIKDIPPRPWAYGHYLLRGRSAYLAGRDGIGKGIYAVGIATCFVLRRALLGEFVWRGGDVAIISYEDDRDEWRRRIAAFCIRYELPYEEIVGHFHFFDRPIRFAAMDEGKIVSPDSVELITWLRRIGAALLIVDPYNHAHELGDGNNNALMARVAEEIDRVAAAADLAALILHHVRKGSSGDIDDIMGATSQRATFRASRVLQRMRKEDAKKLSIDPDIAWRYFQISDSKENYAIPVSRATWFCLNSIALGNVSKDYLDGDSVAACVSWTPAVAAGLTLETIDAIIQEIDVGLPDGQRYSNHANATDRAAYKVILIHAPEIKEEAAREVINEWVRCRVLVVKDYTNPVRREKERGLFAGPKKESS
jgi:DNA polymerase